MQAARIHWTLNQLARDHDIVVKRAFADFDPAGLAKWKHAAERHGIELRHHDLPPTRKKVTVR